MIRKLVALEGKESPDGRKLAIGSIYIADDDKIPVVLQGNQEKVLGYATRLHRDVFTGEVSVDLAIHPSFDLDIDEYDANVFLSPFDTMGPEGHEVITVGRLREVSLSWNPVRKDAI